MSTRPTPYDTTVGNNTARTGNDNSAALKFVYANENMAVRSYSQGATANYSLLNRDSVLIVDCTAGNVTLTLRPANSWGPEKTPIIIVKRIDASANTLTIQRGTGTDTIDGGAAIAVLASASVTLVTNAVSAWWSV